MSRGKRLAGQMMCLMKLFLRSVFLSLSVAVEHWNTKAIIIIHNSSFQPKKRRSGFSFVKWQRWTIWVVLSLHHEACWCFINGPRVRGLLKYEINHRTTEEWLTLARMQKNEKSNHFTKTLLTWLWSLTHSYFLAAVALIPWDRCSALLPWRNNSF